MFASLCSSLPVTLRRAGWIALAASTLGLTACGGGGDRAEEYKPDRIVAFGDESSAFGSVEWPVSDDDGSLVDGSTGQVKGLTYAVNVLRDLLDTPTNCAYNDADALCLQEDIITDVITNPGASFTTKFAYFASINPDAGVGQGGLFNIVTKIQLGTGDYPGVTSGAIKSTLNQFYDCATATIWTQYVARAFGKGFEDECQADLPGAVSYASAGAKVADLATQITAARDAGQLKSGTLVTLWLGQNDIVEIFDSGLPDKVTEVESRAKALIADVKRIMDTGAKVILVNAPNLAYSPFALERKTTGCNDTSKDCNGDMEALVSAFNKQLLASLGEKYTSRGRQLGFVDAERLSNLYARDASYENKRQCDSVKMLKPDGTDGSGSLLYCTTETLDDDEKVASYLWADDLRLARTLHSVIGQTAITRAAEQF